MALTDELKRARLEAGLRQRDIAEALGVSRPAVTQIERGGNTDYRKVELWAERCGFRVTLQPAGTADALASLQEADRLLIQRLAELLPHLPPLLRDDLEDRLETWRRRFDRQDGAKR